MYGRGPKKKGSKSGERTDRYERGKGKKELVREIKKEGQ